MANPSPILASAGKIPKSLFSKSRITSKDFEYSYYPDFLSSQASRKFQDAFLSKIRWRQENIKLFGKTVPQPRLIAWYGDPGIEYAYSGLKLKALPWSDELKQIRDQAQSAAQHRFNSVLMNLYRNGRDSMGWHSDDEPELGPDPVVASVSLGAERFLHFKSRSKPACRSKILLEDGSLLVMAAGHQCRWRHQLPQVRREIGVRINLTFRSIVVA
jgi:alkylated DNA repair dioxygenase AlkB